MTKKTSSKKIYINTEKDDLASTTFYDLKPDSKPIKTTFINSCYGSVLCNECNVFFTKNESCKCNKFIAS